MSIEIDHSKHNCGIVPTFQKGGKILPGQKNTVSNTGNYLGGKISFGINGDAVLNTQ
jgi:hypothetical protein